MIRIIHVPNITWPYNRPCHTSNLYKTVPPLMMAILDEFLLLCPMKSTKNWNYNILIKTIKTWMPCILRNQLNWTEKTVWQLFHKRWCVTILMENENSTSKIVAEFVSILDWISSQIVHGERHYPKREPNRFLIVSFLIVCYKNIYFPSWGIMLIHSSINFYFIFKKAHIFSIFKKAKSV